MHSYTPYLRLLWPDATHIKKYHIGFHFKYMGAHATLFNSCLPLVTIGFYSADLMQVSVMPGPPSIVCTLYSSAVMHGYTS